MPFQAMPGKLWRVKVSENGASKNLFLTAPNGGHAEAQAITINPKFRIEETQEPSMSFVLPRR